MLKNKFYIRVSPSGLIETNEFDPLEDINEVIHDALDGSFYEIVRCRSLPHKFLMLVDDCGLLKELDYNDVASELYGVRIHGPAIFMREDMIDGEPDIVGLTEEDTAELINWFRKFVVIREVRD